MKYAVRIDTPVGPMTLAADEEAITNVDFGMELPQGAELRSTPLLQKAADELNEYFAGTRRAFSVPLAPKGTAFQQLCWDALTRIPYGETISYGEEARRIQKPKASRAVGMANHYNPIAILIPCHRVIGKDGKLTGYGSGLPIKQFLLSLEANGKGTFQE